MRSYNLLKFVVAITSKELTFAVFSLYLPQIQVVIT
jgi:hypothetical protein